MGVPGWLLNLVLGFLTNREMKVRCKGCNTQSKYLPGGGPQGSLLRGFVFLILNNLCGFSNQEFNVGQMVCQKREKFQPDSQHAKYVDDMTILESINLMENLVDNPTVNGPATSCQLKSQVSTNKLRKSRHMCMKMK